jgi:integrase
MKQQDITSFLNRYRKPDVNDPMHKWIGTYNHYLTILISFFKWLYYPEDAVNDRPKPPAVKNIGMLTRREVETYNHTDLWTLEDDELFFKYCNSKRLKCYHAISRDTSARPHELTSLKRKDVQFRQNADKTQFVEVPVHGKTGSRFLPLFNSVPYVKDYLDNEHPQPNNPDAPFLCGVQKHLGKHIQPSRPTRDYADEKNAFTKLLDNPNVPPEDKAKIKLLLAKPWHAYIRRHSALTEKASNPDIAAVLESHAGWKEGSKMKKKYIHHFQNTASNSILQAYGVLPKDPDKLKLRVKQCPQCNEPNTPESKFCAKCRMVLTYDGYQEALESQKEKELEVQRLQQKYEQDMKTMREEMNQQFNQIMSMIQQNPKLAQIKTEVLGRKKIN